MSTYLAEYGEATVLHVEGRSVRVARVRPRGVAGGGQRHVPHADGVEGAQHRQGSAQRVAALDSGEGAQLLVLVCLNNVCRGLDGVRKQIKPLNVD